MEAMGRLRAFLRESIGNVAGLSGEMDPNALNVASSYTNRGDAGAFYNCDAVNSFVLDDFLYNEEEQLALGIDNFFCPACNVTCPKRRCKVCKQHTSPRSQISCSYSMADLADLSTDLGDVSGLQLIDVGSRLGNVLYYFALTTYVRCAVGVEMDAFFVSLTESTIERFHRDWDDCCVGPDGEPAEPRLQVIGGDIRLQKDLLVQSDVVVLNNPFEQLFRQADARELWCFIRANCCRTGQRLVTSPPLRETFTKLAMLPSMPPSPPTTTTAVMNGRPPAAAPAKGTRDAVTSGGGGDGAPIPVIDLDAWVTEVPHLSNSHAFTIYMVR